MKYYICYGVFCSFVCLHYFIWFYKMDKVNNKKVLIIPNSLNNNANSQGVIFIVNRVDVKGTSIIHNNQCLLANYET